MRQAVGARTGLTERATVGEGGLIQLLVLALMALLTTTSSAQESVPGQDGELHESSAKPWRWADAEREPFHGWHTNVETQKRLYSDAYAGVSEVLGVSLSGGIEVVMTPAYSFTLVNMEIGAKDGSLLHDISVARAMALLSFDPARDHKLQTIGADWRGDPDSAAFYAGGMYAPKHVRRMLLVNPDRTEEQVAHILRHELVHALQDEAYPFADFFNYDGITIDSKWARQAVEEGYATLAASPGDDYADPFLTTAVEMMDSTEWPSRLIGLSYGAGSQLVEGVSSRTDSRRELLSLLFEQPPSTTREVLHPQLYDTFLELSVSVKLPEPEAFRELATTLSKALADVGHEAAWRTRLGEFGLQCILVEMGMTSEKAVRHASAWRNDELINFGELREPAASVSVWCLASPVTAGELADALRELAEARGADVIPVSVALADQTITGYGSVGDGELPPVLIIREGETVCYGVGDGLRGVINALRASR